MLAHVLWMPRPIGRRGRASGGNPLQYSAVLAQNTSTGQHGASQSKSPQSKAPASSCAYLTVHAAAVARKASLEAQVEARQAATRLNESKTERSLEHETITADIERVKKAMRMSTRCPNGSNECYEQSKCRKARYVGRT